MFWVLFGKNLLPAVKVDVTFSELLEFEVSLYKEVPLRTDSNSCTVRVSISFAVNPLFKMLAAVSFGVPVEFETVEAVKSTPISVSFTTAIVSLTASVMVKLFASV